MRNWCKQSLLFSALYEKCPYLLVLYNIMQSRGYDGPTQLGLSCLLSSQMYNALQPLRAKHFALQSIMGK